MRGGHLFLPGVCHFLCCIPGLVIAGSLRRRELNIHSTQSHVLDTALAGLDISTDFCDVPPLIQ